ncbi:MAG: hypothetical protein IPL46_14605 [Saprospiraceae bacterium]|nr:hypothetical protein [Saprospiraceae bacterium]
MKVITLLLLMTVALQVQAQPLIYNLDTSEFSILKSPSDTILKAGNRIQSYKNFRVQSDASSGYINLVSQLNPNILLYDADLNRNVELLSNFNGSGAVKVYHHNANGIEVSKIELISNFAQTEDSRIITDEIEIQGGSDLAELFEITGLSEKIKPGMLVSLDPTAAGKLRQTQSSYDPFIAGVVSGANGIKPGILMGQHGTIAHGEELVTISGRTYITCNTTGGSIRIGDLLTSSNVPGEAMRAGKMRKARGAIIGKAMSNLEEGEGYVLVLVNLQ